MSKKIFLIGSIILIIDQVSKSLIEVYFNLNETYPLINNFFAITRVENTGGAWSIFSNMGYLFIILSLLALLILLKFMFTFKNNFRNTLAFGLTIGGIASNLADRIFLGFVRDFLDFTIFSYDYPIFNLADTAIVIGTILLIIAIIKGEDKVAKSKK